MNAHSFGVNRSDNKLSLVICVPRYPHKSSTNGLPLEKEKIFNFPLPERIFTLSSFSSGNSGGG